MPLQRKRQRKIRFQMHPRNIHFGYLNEVVRPHIDNYKVALRNENFFQSYKRGPSQSFLNETLQSNILLQPVPVLVLSASKYMLAAGYSSLQLPHLVSSPWKLLEISVFFPVKFFIKPNLVPNYWPIFLWFVSGALIMYSLYCLGILPVLNILNNAFGTYTLLNKP